MGYLMPNADDARGVAVAALRTSLGDGGVIAS